MVKNFVELSFLRNETQLSRTQRGLIITDKVIFWDFDGTLGWRDGAWSGTLHTILARHDPNSAVTVEHIREHLQCGFPWQEPERPHPHLSTADEWWVALAPVFAQVYERVGVDSKQASILAASVRTQYLSDPGWHLYEDVIPTLRALCTYGWRHVILSNHVPELRSLVTRLGLDVWVSAVVSSAEIGYEKPHEEAYRQALALAGDPTRVWMVGDNCEADVLGAEKAGIKAILVRKQDPRAMRSAPSLAEAASMIRSEETGHYDHMSNSGSSDHV